MKIFKNKKIIKLVLIFLLLVLLISGYFWILKPQLVKMARNYSQKGFEDFRVENYNQAFLNYKKAVTLNSADANSHFYLGVLYYLASDKKSATSEFKKSQKLDSGNYLSPLNLAIIYREEKNYDEAISVLNQNYTETNDDINFKLGEVYLAKEDFENAQNYLGKSIKANSQNHLARYYLAIVLATKDLTQSEKEVEKITSKDFEYKTFPDTNLLYYLFPKEVDFKEKAVTLAENLAKLKRARTQTYKSTILANIYAESLELDLAISEIEKALVTDLKYRDGWLVKGKILYLKEDYTAALESFNKAVELDKTNGLIYYFLGRTYQKLENKDQAISNLEKAIDLKYGGDEVKKELEELK